MPNLDLRTAIAAEPITITRHDGEVFTARPDLPAITAIRARAMSGDSLTIETALTLLDELLEPESAERAAALFTAGAIGIHEFTKWLRFLIEAGAGRPTSEPTGS